MRGEVDVHTPEMRPLTILEAAARSGADPEAVRILAAARSDVVGFSSGELLVRPRIVEKLSKYVQRGTIEEMVRSYRNRSNSSLS